MYVVYRYSCMSALVNVSQAILYKWKNHFSEMKGNVGMSPHEKEDKQEDAYTKTESHSTLSLHLFFVYKLFLSLHFRVVIHLSIILQCILNFRCTLFNPWRACAARVTVVGSVCVLRTQLEQRSKKLVVKWPRSRSRN